MANRKNHKCKFKHPRLLKPETAPRICDTHQDSEQRGARRRVFRQADVVQGLAEDGAVVVLIDQLNKDTGEPHVVRHGLIGVELGRDSGTHFGLQCVKLITTSSEQGSLDLPVEPPTVESIC